MRLFIERMAGGGGEVVGRFKIKNNKFRILPDDDHYVSTPWYEIKSHTPNGLQDA